MNKNNKSEKVIILWLCLLLSVFFNSTICYGAGAPVNVPENMDGISSEVVSVDVLPTEEITIKTAWADSFELIDGLELENIITSADDVGSAVKHSNTGNLYIVLKNGGKYKVEENTTDLINYLKVIGKNVSPVQFVEDTQSTSKKLNYWYIAGISTIVAIGLGTYIRKKRESKNLVYVNATQEKSAANQKDIPTVKFSDIEGIDELKEDMLRLVDCLKNPDRYYEIGARIPKGVILYGPPGTGKTLIAKAIAGEAGVPFFSACGSDFVEKYVGVGASRVRDLYKSARKAAPCIVFIDEIDAVASQRGADENSERDQTINALLAELDGFTGRENIITICATNRLDMLDSAFKRAGRFDLKLAVGLPDKKGRERILRVHSKDKKLAEEVNLAEIATRTVDFSGAELEALLNESAMVAIGKDKTEIDNEDIDDAFFKIVMQGTKKKRALNREVDRVVAWHEAGHTLATKLLTSDNVTSVTIVGSSSGAGGVTFRNPSEDNILQSKTYLESLVQVMYAGRAAEELYFDNKDSITTGASQDIKQATSVIREYLSLYGMGKHGMIDISQFSNTYDSILAEAKEMSEIYYQKVLGLLRKNYTTLKCLAEELLKKETLSEAEIDEIIAENEEKENL